MQTILYKLDATRRVREWCVWQEDRNRTSTVFIRHGLLNGEKQFDKAEFEGPDAAKLAKTEMNRRIDYMMKRRGYTTSIPVDRPYRPMLAKVYQKGVTALPPVIMAQHKFNGHRCLASSKWMMSRTAGIIKSCPHIQKALSKLPPEVVLDGELYCHGESLQNITSWANMNREHDNSRKLSYYVYDLVEEQIPFSERIELVNQFILDLRVNFIADQFTPICPIVPVDTVTLSPDKIDNFFNQSLELGYEGTMIRFPDGLYELNVRSYNLLKYKPKQTKWYKILDVVPGSGRAQHDGIAVCATSDGKHFRVNLAMQKHAKQDFLRNKFHYIGKNLLVEFVDLSDDGIPTCLSGKDIK